jgi:polysaccharide chain length determinant protein (PEP-CTERM system associated)
VDDLKEFLLMLKRRWRIVVWCATLSMCAAYVYAYTAPVLYRSTGTIIVERADIPEDLAKTTVANVLEQRLELVRRRVLTPESLQPVVDEFDLFAWVISDQRAGALESSISVEQVNPITLEPELGGAAFSVNFDYPDRNLVRPVAARIVNLFLEDNQRARTEAAADTERFFASQGERLAEDIASLEEELAEFKQENRGLLPQDIRRNEQTLVRLERELSETQGDIRLATERRNLLIVQRDQIAESTELAQLKQELAAARQVYTDDHPTIRRLLRNVAAAESRVEDPKLQDPELRRVNAQLAAVDDQIAADQRTEVELARRIAELQGQLVLAPEVEKRLQELTRDYDLAVAEYREIRQKRGDAEIARNLEAENLGEQYALIRMPRTPRSSFYPNRVGIMLIGVMLAFGSGIGLAVLLEGADSTVRSSRDIVDAFGAPPIASIPLIYNAADIRWRRLRLSFHGIGLAMTVGVAIGIVVL